MLGTLRRASPPPRYQHILLSSSSSYCPSQTLLVASHSHNTHSRTRTRTQKIFSPSPSGAKRDSPWNQLLKALDSRAGSSSSNNNNLYTMSGMVDIMVIEHPSICFKWPSISSGEGARAGTTVALYGSSQANIARRRQRSGMLKTSNPTRIPI